MSARSMTGHLSALTRVDHEGRGEGLLTQDCNIEWNPASADGWSLSITWSVYISNKEKTMLYLINYNHAKVDSHVNNKK